MAVDAGLKDTYLDRINRALVEAKDQLGVVRDREREAALQDQALASLTAAERTLLVTLLPHLNTPELQAKEAALVNSVQALQDLRAAVRAL